MGSLSDAHRRRVVSDLRAGSSLVERHLDSSGAPAPTDAPPLTPGKLDGERRRLRRARARAARGAKLNRSHRRALRDAGEL